MQAEAEAESFKHELAAAQDAAQRDIDSLALQLENAEKATAAVLEQTQNKWLLLTIFDSFKPMNC